MLKEKTCFPYEWLTKENIFDKQLPSIDKFYSSDTKVKADMFNKFFINQFSDASSYNIDISFQTITSTLTLTLIRSRTFYETLTAIKPRGLTKFMESY